MTPASFKSAQLTLGLNNAQMATWLGVSLRTVEQWRATGPSKLGARAVRCGIALVDIRKMSERSDEQDDFRLAAHIAGTKASLALDWRE